jgi:hypothetical protein
VVPSDGVKAGVHAVARVDAADGGRDAAGDGEPAHGRPLPDGREVAGDLHGRVGRAGLPVGPLEDVGHEPLLERVYRGRRRNRLSCFLPPPPDLRGAAACLGTAMAVGFLDGAGRSAWNDAWRHSAAWSENLTELEARAWTRPAGAGVWRQRWAGRDPSSAVAELAWIA